MFEHWILPHEGPSYYKDYLADDRLGSNLSSLTSQPMRPEYRTVALLGADAKWAKTVRRHLYQFAYRMSDLRIYDLGDLRRSDPDFVLGPMIELLSSQICPILIGANFGVMKALQRAFVHLKTPFHPVVIHEAVPESLIASMDKTNLIGVQQHLIPRKMPTHLQIMHLSEARHAMQEAETMIRDSNSIIFDLTAMSQVDLPAQKSLSSSGFCTEEACLLMRFAGLHPDTRALMITGHDPMSLQQDMSANTAAQLIWYFLEACNQCITEDPLKSTHCTTYAVHLDMYDTGFTFYKSERTGRWWVQMHTGNREPVFPCTYKDYLTATNGQVSDRLIACANASLESTQQAL